jgi:hypothetical protein
MGVGLLIVRVVGAFVAAIATGGGVGGALLLPLAPHRAPDAQIASERAA